MSVVKMALVVLSPPQPVSKVSLVFYHYFYLLPLRSSAGDALYIGTQGCCSECQQG